MRTFSVAEITRYIHELLYADEILGDVRVRGEVSNLTKARSGHWYFTLKDAKSQLRCVMFRGAARYVRIDLRAGDEILAHGRVSVYEARGEYQLYVDVIEALGGIGDLQRQFEALKARLDAEGLFDPERKRALPAFPRRIGIVTSETAAAYQDMLKVVRRRFPLLEIVLSPSQVQGKDAPAQIVAALRRLDGRGDIDLIIVARGGGSIEDLWCFNDESVARAIAASRVPVISGIGHEIDFTIADFVADLRAPTPSSAAELATPNRDDLLLELDDKRDAMRGHLDALLRDRVRGLQQLRRGLDYASPMRGLGLMRERLGNLRWRLGSGVQGQLGRLGERQQIMQRRLNAADPRQILAKGYALVQDEAGNSVRSAAQAQPRQRLRVRFHRDEMNVRVES